MWVCATSNAWLTRGVDQIPFGLCLEMLAQGALSLLHQGPEGGGSGDAMGLLAGIDEAEMLRPIEPGDQLRISVRLVGRFGPLIKAAGQIGEDDQPYVRAMLLLAAASAAT